MITTKWKVGLFCIAIFIFSLGIVSSQKMAEWYDRFNQTEIVLSEQGDSLSTLFQSSYSTKLDIAKIEGRLALRQGQLTFSQQVSDQASKMLDLVVDEESIKVGAGDYSPAEVQEDLALRQSMIPEIQEGIKRDQRELARLKDVVMKIDNVIKIQSAQLNQQGLNKEVVLAQFVALMNLDGTGQVKVSRFFDAEDGLNQAMLVFDGRCAVTKNSEQVVYELSSVVDWQSSPIPDYQWKQAIPSLQDKKQEEDENRPWKIVGPIEKWYNVRTVKLYPGEESDSLSYTLSVAGQQTTLLRWTSPMLEMCIDGEEWLDVTTMEEVPFTEKGAIVRFRIPASSSEGGVVTFGWI